MTTSQSLRSAFDYIALTSRSGRYVTPAAEWLLDNFHLVEAQLAADPRRRAAPLLRAPAQARGAAAGRPAARLRHRLGLRGAHRQRAQPASCSPPSSMPTRTVDELDARRAVGAADHAARGAAGEPAPRGREHRREQGGARGGACGLGRGRRADRRTTSTCCYRAMQSRGLQRQLPDPALAAAAGRARRRAAASLARGPSSTARTARR